MLVDLHAHSSMSDGSYSPQELVDFAIKQNIGVLALCDHDTTAGLEDFLAYTTGKAIRAIPGVELSATWKKGNCHIVGLGVRKGYEPLESVLQQTRDSRDNRNEHIIKKLLELQIAINLDEVEALAGGEVVARPHMARIMVARGYVSSVQEAFDKYLAKDAPAYVDRYRLDPEKSVSLLKEAGAQPVLAHPSQLSLSTEQIDALVEKLKSCGLAGLEVYTPYTSDENIEPYCAIAEKHGLFIGGGSDFHGESKPDHYLGYYRKGRAIPGECAEGI